MGYLEVRGEEGGVEPDDVGGVDVQAQEHRHALAELVVTEEVEGHEGLDVLDPPAFVVQGLVADVGHSHGLGGTGWTRGELQKGRSPWDILGNIFDQN